MKTIWQTLLIVVISLLVVGGAYGISQTDWAASQSLGRRPPGVERTQTSGEGVASAERPAPPSGERQGDHYAARPLSLASVGSFVRILLPMGLMIGAVGLVRRRGLKRQVTTTDSGR